MHISELVVQSGTFNSVSEIVNRFFALIVGVSAVIVALLWLPIAIGFFSEDEKRRAEAKIRAKYAFFGTVIFILAITGTLYAIVYYVATGT